MAAQKLNDSTENNLFYFLILPFLSSGHLERLSMIGRKPGIEIQDQWLTMVWF